MGNLESTFLRVCGSALKRQKLNSSIVKVHIFPLFLYIFSSLFILLKDEENSNFIIRNKDGYFHRDDFNKITQKFPEYKDWPEQNSSPCSAKDKQRHKKIK